MGDVEQMQQQATSPDGFSRRTLDRPERHLRRRSSG